MAIQAPTLYMHKDGEYITVGPNDVEVFIKSYKWAVVPYEKKETHNAMGDLISSVMIQDISKLKPQGLKAVKAVKEEKKK